MPTSSTQDPEGLYVELEHRTTRAKLCDLRFKDDPTEQRPQGVFFSPSGH